ncbi:hypothetical protein [Mesorhizobium sp.]|uniref:hypothetical protein n=1 Tax=Mesorhizobium sp. TaxID=1871066 RepID=UPI000FE8872E|nr:hypothetical protein [Mesorhizobium sp.]RWI35470.1 MAG: hypothetical protein EOR14_28625 [Mesorhizobium sp.]RWJ66361.1 MAG: hypothetical protein EOR34_28510 [Mesorhizobium sp.]
MTEKTEQQKQLETVINRAGRAFDVLVKEIEKIDLTGAAPETIDVAFNHLAHLLELSRQRAQFARQVSGFSFDNPAIELPATGPAFQRPRLHREQQPRLVGERPVKKQQPAVDPDTEAFLDDD